MAAVAFLRGMNLGGRRITNEALAAAFEALGFSHPTPYQASGNVILPAEAADEATGEHIESGLAGHLGYSVPTFLRSADEIARMVAESPFLERTGPDGGKPQIILLRRGVSPTPAFNALRQPDDEWLMDGTELHWLPAGGLSQTELNFSQLDKVIGVNTVRTLGTMQRLAKKLTSAQL